MTDDLLNEVQLKEQYFTWQSRHSRIKVIPHDETPAECAKIYPMPDFEYVFEKTYSDKDGDRIVLLRSNNRLSDWQSRDNKKHVFSFYKVLKLFADTPDVEPFPMGYWIKEIY